MILGSANSIEKRLGDNLMSRRWQDRRYELRTNRRPGRAVSGGVCQNLAQNVLLGIIGGTIGWHVAYSLLRAMDSIASMWILPFEETGGDLKLVLGQELGREGGRGSGVLSWHASPDISRPCTSNTWSGSGRLASNQSRRKRMVLDRACDGDVS